MNRGRPPESRRTPAAIAAGLALLAAIGAYLFIRDSGPLATIESQTLDWRFRLRGSLPPNGDIVLVIADEASLGALGGWPLPRRVLARAVNRLTAAGARAVAIDLLFTESRIADDPRGDADLAQAIALSAPVVLPVAFRFAAHENEAPPQGLSQSAFRLVRLPEGASPPMRFQPTGALSPPAHYLAHASAGHVNLFPDTTGIIRFVHLAMPFGERYYPALPVELARLYLGVGNDAAVAVIGEGVRLGQRFIETDSAMRAVINYRGDGGGFERVSLLDLIEGNAAPDVFEGRAVLIGAAATGLGDSFATPFAGQLPGVALLATVTDNILEKRFLRAGALARSIDLGAILMVGALLVLLIHFRRAGLAAAAAGLAAAGWLGACHLAFVRAELWLNASLPAISFLLLGGICLIELAGREWGGRRRAEARGAQLGRYVSPLVERHLARGGPPEAVHAIAMFADMRGFTRDSEAAAPGDIADRLRAFHGRVERAVAAHGGVIDKYLGDGVLAVFGEEGARPGDAAAALACARELVDPAGGPALGVGLHAGPLVVGELGGEERAEVSVAGDTVNVASRLQEMTKSLDAGIVASDAVIEAARAADPAAVAGFEPRSAQRVRGRERPLDLWTWRRGG